MNVEMTEESKNPIVERLQKENPLFHDDGSGKLISWYSNLNLLGFIENYLQPGMRTIETGAGYSTVLFIAKQCYHTCIVPSADEVERIKIYCTESDIGLDKVEFIIGESHKLLPAISGKKYDVAFIDGAHRFPFPVIDWFFCMAILEDKGLMIIDDTDIVSCHILIKFMMSDSHWQTVNVRENFGIFRKLGGYYYPSDWLGQAFSSKKIDSEETFMELFFPTQKKSDIDDAQ